MSRDNEERQLVARAVARRVPMSDRKVRRIVDLVRGRHVDDALDILRFDPHAASAPVYKVVTSAVANAENNLDLDPRTLWISTIFVDQGTTLPRMRPRAQGRAYRIRKRACHITVEIESRPERRTAAGRSRGGRGGTSKKATQTRSVR